MGKGNVIYKLTYLDFEKILLSNQLDMENLSKKISISQSTLSRIFNKESKTILKTANIISKALHQKTYDLFEIKE